MHTFALNADILSRQGAIFFAGAYCAVSTNADALLDTLARSATISATHSFLGARTLTMHLLVHNEVLDFDPVPHFRGQQHIVVANFGAGNVFVFDMLRRHIHGTVSQSIARDAAFWREKLLPIAVGVMGSSIGILPVHAACFSFEGEGLLIAGASGAGKSTLSAALCMSGIEYLADDWTYITQDRGALLAHGAAAPIKLLPDAARHFPVLASRQPRISMNGELAFEVHAAPVFKAKIVHQCMPRHLVFLERREQPGISFTPVPEEFTRAYLDRNVERLPAQMGDAVLRRVRLMNAVAALPSWKMSYGGSPAFAADHVREFMRNLRRVSA